MKKNLFALIVFGISFFIVATGSAANLFGPNVYTRTTGEPNTYSETFESVPGEYYLFITNGDENGNNRVSSASIYINDDLIFEPNDFHHYTDILKAPVQLSEINTIILNLSSTPGSYLTIEIKTYCPLIFGPSQFVRTKGKPNVYTETFIATPGEGFLTVINGDDDGSNRVSSALIYVNGLEIFEQKDFKNKDYLLAAALDLSATNSITVKLSSTPGSYLNIEFCQNPPTVDLSVMPDTIIEGQSAELSWISDFALETSIDNGIGDVVLNSSMTVSPIETTTYTITASNVGASMSDSVTLTVIPLPRVTLTATPSTIIEGQSFDLSWTSLHSDTVVIDNGIGEVELNGTIPLSPVVDKTYIVTATGPGGTATASVFVTVIPLPEITAAVNPATIIEGDSCELSWTSENADTVVIDNGIGDIAVNGSMFVSPDETTTYTFTATGPGGTSTTSAIVTVYHIPTVTLNADPDTILEGGFSILSWTSEHADTVIIDNGVGMIGPNGSTRVSPSETTNYTITATGPGGTAFASATVTVRPQGVFTEDNFEEGTLENIEPYDNSLQLTAGVNTLPFIWIANSGQGTVSKINTITGEELGRYRTGPSTGTNPSRTTVDSVGNLWVGNRNTASATKIMLYPRDKNGDGVITTSTGATNILTWGQDEAIEFYLPAPSGVRAVAIDSNDNVWLGGYDDYMLFYYDGHTGTKLKTINSGRRCYGGLVDKNGTLWISARGHSGLTRVDNPNAGTSFNPEGTHTLSFIRADGDVYGIGIDTEGYIYSAGYSSRRIRKYDPVNKRWIFQKYTGGYGRGVATDSNGNGWMAISSHNKVFRFDLATGNILNQIPVGNHPTGVAVDSEEKVWVTCRYGNSVQRINPTTNSVEFTQTGHPDPYNYSDMTGFISRNITSQNGSWSIVYDSEFENTPWGIVSWHSYEPPGTRIKVKARTSNDESTWSQWEEAESGVIIPDLPDARYIEVNVTLTIQEGDESPLLYDLAILSVWDGFSNTSPEITSEPVIEVEEGLDYLYQLDVIDNEDADFCYTLEIAPDGMDIDETSGLIFWSPDAYTAGEYMVSVKVTDPVGAYDRQYFTLSVVDTMECNGGEERVCGVSVGTCEMGMQTCVNGVWDECVGSVDPQLEICDGLDNNCDGFIDEGVTPPPADKQCGVCAGATKVCGGADGWQEPDYTQIAGYEIAETTVDGIDNDCDCQVDVIKTQVPDLVGMSQWDAETALTDAQLVVGVSNHAYSQTIAEDHVITQEPAAGSVVEVGISVDLVVSLGVPKVEVPDLTGMSQTDAESAILATGHLIVGDLAEVYISSQPAGQVFSQTPLPGMMVPYDTPVDMNISLGAWGGTDETPPYVNLGLSDDNVNIGETVTIFAWTGDDVGVVDQSLTVNEDPLTVVDGQVVYTAPSAGFYTVVLSASDAAGYTTTDSKTFVVFDPFDTTPPTATLSETDCAEVTDLYDVMGEVSDTSGVMYSLYCRPYGTGSWKKFAEGSGNSFTGTLGTFDPTILKNGVYELLLYAQDLAGNTAYDQGCALVDGQLKVGHVILPGMDVNIPNNGFPLALEREYDSRDTTGDFGPGWSLPSSTVKPQTTRELDAGWAEEIGGGFLTTYYLIEKYRHEVVIRFSDEETLRFKMDVNPKSSVLVPIINHSNLSAKFVAIDGTEGTLEALGVASSSLMLTTGNDLMQWGTDPFEPERYRYTRPDGTQYILHMENGIESITDVYGNSVAYSDAGITHSSGASIAFTRGVGNRIETITDPFGLTIEYHYDENGMLEQVIKSGTEPFAVRMMNKYAYEQGIFEKPVLKDIKAPDGTILGQFEYDATGRMIGLVDADNRKIIYGFDVPNHIQEITDRRGFTSVYEYDNVGNVTKKTDSDGRVSLWAYDENNNKTSETDALGNTTYWTYDESGNMLTETDPLGNTTTYTNNDRNDVLTQTDPNGNMIANVYDALGNLLEKTDVLGNVTAYTHDTKGNVLTETDALGNVTTFEYNFYGHRTKEIAPNGKVTEWSFDRYGNELSESVSRTMETGETVTMTTTNTYDIRNRLTRTVDPMGNETRTEYNYLDKESRIIDKNGAETLFEYDNNGKQTAIHYADGTSMLTAYDGEGNRTSTTDRAGRITNFEYDKNNQMTAVIHTDGSSSEMVFDDASRMNATIDENGNQTDFVYDEAGRRSAVVDALGNTVSFGYDAAGNQVSMTDPKGATTTYEYDGLNRQVKTIYPDGTFSATGYDALGRKATETDQAGNVTLFGYDVAGNLVSVTDAFGNLTEYTYDEVGNRLSHTDPNGNTEYWTYDDIGRQVSHTLPLGMSESWMYDAVGNMTSHTDFNGDTVIYEYSPCCGRLTEKIFPDNSSISYTYLGDGKRETVTDSRGITQYFYDSRGRLASITDPDGSIISYTYDPKGNRTSVTVASGTTTYTYDALSRLATVTDPDGGVTAYTYDKNGNREQVENPNGTIAAYTYDSLNRLTYLENRKSNGDIISSYYYTLGPAGNRLSVSENTGREVNYTYDDIYRLTQEEILDPANGNETIAYTYDGKGNRLSKTDSSGVISYNYDINDRLLTETGPAHVYTYSYDNNGNTIAKSAAGESIAYDYNFENQLTGMETLSSRAAYQYDLDGIRVAQDVDGAETAFIVDKNRQYAQVLEERDNLGSLTVQYVYGDDLVSQKRAGVDSYYHYDGLGSTRALTDSSESVTDTYTYEAFGSLINSTGTTENSYLFTGEQYDPNAGFYYLRARYYNPTIGRFVTVDPYAGKTSDPVTLHKYMYANMNPVMFVDPSGEFSTLTTIGASLAIMGGLTNLGTQSILTSYGKRGITKWRGKLYIGTRGAKIGRAAAGLIFADLQSEPPKGLKAYHSKFAIIMAGLSISEPTRTGGSIGSIELKIPAIFEGPNYLWGPVSFISLTAAFTDKGKSLTTVSVGYAYGTLGIDSVEGWDFGFDMMFGASMCVSGCR
ncbi:MAG: PASTA domain-containing protein [Desulfobacteraceae bacterium]|jgi:RHS repeat-associated protein|nr:PASTA domain-containing protein [Desulfobacteraceae bacterium]